MLKEWADLTDAERLFRDKRWQTADCASPGLQLIMEREGSRFFMPNRKGPGTFIGLKDGSTRLLGPDEFRDAGIYARRLEEVWKTFKLEFETRAKEQHPEKTKRLTSDRDHLRLTGCYLVKLPPDWNAEEKREATFTVEFRLSEGVIACSCDPAGVWKEKTLRIRAEPGTPRLIDGERTIEAAVAAEELLNEFTDRLEPCQSQ